MMNVSNDSLAPALLTLNFVATGLVRAFRSAERHDGVWFPYAPALQTGLNRLLLLGIEQKIVVPASVPELVSWCHRPLETWQIAWGDDISGTETLLKDGAPTPFCEETACLNADVEADMTEQHLLRAVLHLCEENDAPQTYVHFRRLLIEKPTLSTRELLMHTGGALQLLQAQVEEAYESVPAALIARDGTVQTCRRCGNVLVPQQDDTLRCGEAECDVSPQTGTIYQATDRPQRLKRGLRVFVAAPGRAELRLAKALAKRGVAVELWPAFDRYDLRLSFADGTVWAVDVKDWQSPYLLAKKLSPRVSLPHSPVWQQGFYVFPDRHKAEWRDYLRVIKARCSFPKNIAVCFERDFLRRVNEKNKQIAQSQKENPDA